MTPEELDDRIDKVIDMAFDAIDQAEITKENVVSAFEVALQRIKDGSYDSV